MKWSLERRVRFSNARERAISLVRTSCAFSETRESNNSSRFSLTDNRGNVVVTLRHMANCTIIPDEFRINGLYLRAGSGSQGHVKFIKIELWKISKDIMEDLYKKK